MLSFPGSIDATPPHITPTKILPNSGPSSLRPNLCYNPVHEPTHTAPIASRRSSSPNHSLGRFRGQQLFSAGRLRHAAILHHRLRTSHLPHLSKASSTIFSAASANTPCNSSKSTASKISPIGLPPTTRSKAKRSSTSSAHPSREAATANWKAFGDDPEWKQVRDASEANGKIVEKVDSTFMTLTDFSPPLR